MPANFTKEEKAALIEKFYTQGYILLKKFGYKKLKIIDIAASVGVGTGTFYNFFKSKDEFIIWLIKRRKDETAEQFLLLSKEYPNGIPMTVFEQFLFDTISHNNIYRCLTQEDYHIAVQRAQEKGQHPGPDSEGGAKKRLGRLIFASSGRP